MLRPLLAVALLAAASPALAQDPTEDWDLTANAEQQLTLATLDFGDNVLALRCQAGTLDLLLTGVPVSTGATRTATVTAGAIAGEIQTWTALPGLPVIGADEPARLARQLREGGELDVRLAPQDAADRPRRYRLTAPASHLVVNTVLTACGEPLDEPRDRLARLPLGTVSWRTTPEVAFPDNPVAHQLGSAVVRLACVVGPDYGLTDCRAETKAPPASDFDDNAIAAAERATLNAPADGSDARGALTRFTVRFVMPTG